MHTWEEFLVQENKAAGYKVIEHSINFVKIRGGIDE